MLKRNWAGIRISMLKRFFDIVLSLFDLILLSPVLIGIGRWIRKEDGGPIFYRGVRNWQGCEIPPISWTETGLFKVH